MPRVIVTIDPSELPEQAPVLLDERVHSVHLSSGHGAAQLIERLAWAISDAEEAEQSRGLRARRRRAARRDARPLGPGLADARCSPEIGSGRADARDRRSRLLGPS
jgi:hypothetical protein